MAVAMTPVSPGEKFEAAPPRALFLSRIWNSAADLSSKQECVVSPDGQRFLMLVEAREAAVQPIRVITNWAGARRYRDSAMNHKSMLRCTVRPSTLL